MPRDDLVRFYFSPEQIKSQREKAKQKKEKKDTLIQMSLPMEVKPLHRIEHEKKLRTLAR